MKIKFQTRSTHLALFSLSNSWQYSVYCDCMNGSMYFKFSLSLLFSSQFLFIQRCSLTTEYNEDLNQCFTRTNTGTEKEYNNKKEQTYYPPFYYHMTFIQLNTVYPTKSYFISLNFIYVYVYNMHVGSHKDPKRILYLLYLAEENIRSHSPEVTSGNG